MIHLFLVLLGLGLIATNLAALITHIIHCGSLVGAQGMEAVAWLILGVFPIPLVGIVHGWVLWFGGTWV